MIDVDELDYIPVTNDIWYSIQYEGLDTEFSNKQQDWSYAIYPIPDEDKRALMNYNDDTTDKYNQLDTRIKEQYNMRYFYLIDNTNGIVYILKHK